MRGSTSHISRTPRLGIALVVACLLATNPIPCRAQPGATAAAVQDAAHKAGEGRWVDAIEQYQRILETAGDDLVPILPPVSPLAALTGGPAFSVAWQGNHFVPARWVCHDHISRFPPAALKQYRDRVDVAAAKRLDEAKKRPDDRSLEQLVTEWFNSRPAEEAIDQLALRAFERADFDAAERYWRMLSAEATSGSLRYPGPRLPEAAVRARLILVRLFRGERAQARSDLKAFRTTFPDAAGLLAGRDGTYADTLDALLKDPKQVTVPTPSGAAREWATFAGNPARNSDVATLPRYWPGPPAWRAELPGEPVRVPDDTVAGAPDHPRALAFHLVVAVGAVFVADATRVFALDLLTGERTTVHDLRKSVAVPGLDLRLPVRSDVRYTLTYANGFLYARLGAQSLRPPRNVEGGEPTEAYSAIVCFGPITDRKSDAIKPLWVLKPPAPAKDATAIFEGTPLVHDGRLYATVWRQTGGEATSSIACFRGLGRESLPEIVWQREVGKPGFNPTAEARARHDLLTLAGPNVVFCTHSGNVVALDARSGKPAWEYRYSRNERRPPPVGRDLTPCLFDGARIFAAPADASRLLCLDAFSGRLLWEIEGIDIVHLLGVARGRLIATFAGPVKGIRGINVVSGAQTLPDGWTQHDGGGVATFGRGFVSHDLIFWPTKHGLQFLDPVDGSPARQPVQGMFGNLCFADGCFVATTATEVLGFVGDGRLLEPRKKELEKQPENQRLIFNLGRSEADVGQVEAAAKRFDDLAKDGNEPARAEADVLLWSEAERLRTLGHDRAGPAYRDLVKRIEAAEHPLRLMSRLRLAQAGERDGKAAEAVASWQALIDDCGDELGPLVEIDGRPRLLKPFAADALARLTDRRAKSAEAPARRALADEATFDVSAPLRRAWHVAFTESRWRPLPPVPGATTNGAPSLWLLGKHEFARLDLRDGERRLRAVTTTREYEAGFRYNGHMVLVGGNSITAREETTDRKAWSWTVAVSESGEASPLRRPAGFCDGRLSAFHHSGGRFFALLDGTALLAIDATTGHVLWEHWAVAPRALRGEGAVLIRPFFYAGELRLLLQLSTGAVRIIDARDGKTLGEMPGSRRAWDAGPIAIDERTVAFADAAEAIVCLDLDAGRAKWRHTVERPSSLIGSPSRLRYHDGALFVGIERNQGFEVDALDARTGERLWAEPLSLGIQRVRLDALGFDAKSLFVPTEDGLLVVARESGKIVRESPLTDLAAGEWRVLVGKTHVIAYPRAAQPLTRIDAVGFTWPAFDVGLPLRLARSYHAMMDRTFPVLLIDKSDGRLVQRLQFSARGPAGDVRVVKGGLVVVTGAGIWGLAASP